MYSTPAQRLKELIHPFHKKYHHEFWALKNVSFEINHGETIGIVGRNGSGKSTLLQILCGILRPTSGEITVSGRVSALLELGAGFNPEFTGRENVYINGAIMGLSQKEIDAKYEDVISFADIGEFINQPVKMYSSGMYVRLAFAVAINVEPDILVVDEALTVGDEAFQRKCFSRIQQIQENGGTVLFVSHTASIILELCNRAILLDQGETLLIDKPKIVVSRYQKLIYAPSEKLESVRNEIKELHDKSDSGTQNITINNISDPSSNQNYNLDERDYYDPNLISKSTILYESFGAIIKNPQIYTKNGKKVNVLSRGSEYIYTYEVSFTEAAYSVRCGMLIKTVSGLELGGIVSHVPNNSLEFVEKGMILRPKFTFKCALLPGVYFLNAGVVGMINGTETYLHRCIDVVIFRVQPEGEILLGGVVDFSPNQLNVTVDVVKAECLL